MSIRITDESMTSNRTRHTAELWPTPESGESPTMWPVSWLPERPLGRNEATTAMVLADVLAVAGEMHCENPLWPRVDSWAAELGLSGPDAVVRVSEPPEAAREL